LPLTVDEGFRGADPDLFLVFAVIALCRNGKIDPKDVYRIADRLAATSAITKLFEEREEPEADEDHPRLASVSESNK
jgi:hypothetical protein